MFAIRKEYLELRKSATAHNNFEEVDYFKYASTYNVHVYQFSAKIGLVYQSETVHANLIATNLMLHKSATININF